MSVSVKSWTFAIVLMATIISVLPAQAEQEDPFGFAEAAAHYQVSAELLEALSVVESGHQVDALNEENFNDSTDHGHMQINTCWKDELEAHSPGAWERLRTDAKFCSYVGAWVLRHYVDKFGHNWDAVSGYHTNHSLEHLRKRAESAKLEMAHSDLSPEKEEELNARIKRFERAQKYVQKVYTAMKKIMARNGNEPKDPSTTKIVVAENKIESSRPLKRSTK